MIYSFIICHTLIFSLSPLICTATNRELLLIIRELLKYIILIKRFILTCMQYNMYIWVIFFFFFYNIVILNFKISIILCFHLHKLRTVSSKYYYFDFVYNKIELIYARDSFLFLNIFFYFPRPSLYRFVHSLL